MKKCQQCQKPFTPARPMQVVCSPLCASRKVRQDREAKQKAEREQTKKRKEALKTIPDLIKEAQVAFNRWIRARDHDKPCISCGAPPPNLDNLHAGRDAGHWRSTGSASHLRFHEDNCNAQCVKCNQWGAGMAVEYRRGLIGRIGLERVEALENNNTPHKWQREELEQIRDTYRAKLKAMK